MIRHGLKWLLIALVFGPRAGGHAADREDHADWPPVHAYSPIERLASAARARQVDLTSFLFAPAAAKPDAGDTIVLLVVLDERSHQTQWLVRLRGPASNEATSKPVRRPETVVYGMDGRAIRFRARREHYSILALGPVRGGETEVPVPARDIDVEMNAAFLDERFDQAVRFMLRTAAARREGRLGEDEFFTFLPRRPRLPDPAARQRFVDEAELTDGDERAVAATVPALSEFVRILAETPGLQEVLFSVVEKPSWWSLIVRFGRVETDFRFRSGEIVPSAEAPAGFSGIGRCAIVPFTFSINGRPALECTILVAEPRPPLRMCAGIVAVVASAPGRPDVRLIVRVLAAKHGGAEGTEGR